MVEKNKFFDEIHGNFGFGCMRLPMIDKEVDIEQVKHMVDRFIASGFNYFDTAHGYIGGRSELAVKECLANRYPRESFLLTNKLTGPYFEKEEDVRPFFESQLEACGVEYFDFYLMHAQNAKNFEQFKACRAYETAFALKAEGKVRHVGLSFHDSPEVLDMILNTYPEVEAVQLQFNYADYEDDSVQSRRCYEVCEKHGKPVIIMEPVKGGNLVELPEKPQKILDDFRSEKGIECSNASYAIRFAASFPSVFMVLSGMSNTEQMEDNVITMRDFKPLDEEEFRMIFSVRDAIESLKLVKCTGCRYCVTDNECPMNIPIPSIFRCLNSKYAFNSRSAKEQYGWMTHEKGKASDCLQCGMCEEVCPQHLPIRELLEKAVDELEN
jgi:predicted aldo/keto reductase-like oxidoreductase